MANNSNRVPAVVAEAEAAFSPEETAYIESGGETSLGEPTPPVTRAPEEEPTATAAPAASPEPSASPEPQKMVPHGALHEERERRKASEKELADERKSRLLLEERTNLILQRLNAPPATPAPTQAPLPDAEKDPAGFLSAVLQHVGQRLQTVEQSNQQTRQQRDEQTQLQAIGMRVQAMENEFIAENSDYQDALNYLGQTRAQELIFFGKTDPAERGAILRAEAQQIALAALQNGQNPAELVYNIAKHRGYKGKVAAIPDPTAPPQQSDADKLKLVAKGQEQSTNLGSASGSAPSPKTAARLLEMTNEQFAKAYEDPEWRSLLGA